MNTTNNVSTPLDDRQEYVKELAAEYKIPEPWGIGPVRNASRRCTDKCCYVLFLMVLVAMIGVAIWAILASDPRGVTKVYDSSGNVCGKDAAVNYPILYLQTFERPFKSVCVSECPSFDYNQIKYNSNGVSTYPDGGEIPELDFYQFIANYAGNSYTTAPDLTESESFGYNPSWANGYFTQDQWKAYTSNYKINCLPNKQFSNCKVDNLKFYAYDSYDVMQKVCTPLGTKSGLMFTKVQAAFSNGDFSDVNYAVSIYGYVALIAFGLSLFFLIIMCICPSIISYLLFIVFAFSLMALGVLIFVSYGKVGQLNDPSNALRVKYIQFIITYRIPLLILASLSILLSLFVFFLMCKYRKQIQHAIPLLQYASKSSLKNVMLIFLSAFVLLLQVGVFAIELYVILKIYGSGEENTDFARGQPYATYDIGPLQIAALVLHIFGTYWLIVSLNNFNDFVCAAVTVNHFFHNHLWREIQSFNTFCHCLGHHVGTVNWSVFYLPAFAIKLVFGPIDWITAADKPNCFQRCIRKLFCCCFAVYNKLVRPFVANIYPLTYIGCENFGTTTKRHFYLTEKYHDEADTIIVVGELFSMMAKLLIMIASVGIGYAIYKSGLVFQQNISNVGMMFFIMAFIGYIVGSLCINLFSTTYQTCVMCWLIEFDLYDSNNGNYVEKMPMALKDTFKELETLRNKNYKPLK